MRRTDARGAWAVVDGAGRRAWRSLTAADYEFRGQLEPRPDGGMWILRDASTGPRLTLPDLRGSRLSLRTLRRRGLRLRANEAGHLDAAVQPAENADGLPRIVDRALRRGQTLKLRLPAAWLRRPGATLLISGSITDADGNYGDLPITAKLDP